MERDHDLGIEGFSCGTEDKTDGITFPSVFSVSGIVFRFINFGSKLFFEDFDLDEKVVGAPFALISEGLCVRLKYTFLGVGIIVWPILI